MTQPIDKSLKWRTDLDFAGLRFKNRSATVGATIHCSATKPSQDFGAVEDVAQLAGVVPVELCFPAVAVIP